ncbi:SAP domain-containing protein [Arthrobacter sp. NPDC055138]
MTDHATFSRPEPTASLSAQEFLRWYWLKTELQQFARALGISATGDKESITARIAAVLGGEPAPPQRAWSRIPVR